MAFADPQVQAPLSEKERAALKPLADSETLNFVAQVPLVAGVINHAFSIVKSYSLLFRTYLLGEVILATSLQLASPITSRLSTPLHKVDHFGLQTLDYAKSKFPFPFEAKWEDLLSLAKQPFDKADNIATDYKNTAKENVQHLYDQTNKAVEQLQQNENVYLQKAGNTIVSINESLTKVGQDWSKKTSSEAAEGEKKAQGLVSNLFSELDNLQKYALSLPAEGQKRLSPVIDTFQDTYKEARIEAYDSKLPVQERVSKVTNYLKTQTLPALHKVCFLNIYFLTLGLSRFSSQN